MDNNITYVVKDDNNPQSIEQYNPEQITNQPGVTGQRIHHQNHQVSPVA